MLFRVCNSLLGLKFNMLGTEGGSAAAQDFQNTVLPILMDIITVLLGIIALIVVAYAKMMIDIGEDKKVHTNT